MWRIIKFLSIRFQSVVNLGAKRNNWHLGRLRGWLSLSLIIQIIPAAPTTLCLVDVNLDTFYASIWNCGSDFKANWSNVDTLNLLRRLGVPSAVGLLQIQNQQLTSLVAQMKKLWTYRSCPKRWIISLHYITVIKNASIFRKCQNMGKRHLEMCVFT